MFFFLSKLLKVFIFPLTWILLLFILAYFVKNKKWRRGLFIAAIAVTLVFSNKPLLQWAQYLTTRPYSQQQMPKEFYRIGIVMGGYSNGMNTQTNQPEYINNRGERLWEAIRLYQCGIIEKIMITGDATFYRDQEGTTSEMSFRKYLSSFGIHDTDLILEPKARNTTENAAYSIALLDSLKYHPEECLIITSASHMKRSLYCFDNYHWITQGYAVNIYPKPHISLNQFIPSWQAITDWQELLNEWFGNIAYKIFT